MEIIRWAKQYPIEEMVLLKKTLIVTVLLVAMTMALCVPALAAGNNNGITAEEQALLDEFKAGREIDGVLVTPPAQYISVATNELMRVDLTSEQIKMLSDCIKSIYATLVEEKLTNRQMIEASPKFNAMVSEIQTVAKSLGYTVAYDYNHNGDAIVKQTGFNMTTTLVVGGILVAAIAAAAVVIGRKRLLAKAE